MFKLTKKCHVKWPRSDHSFHIMHMLYPKKISSWIQQYKMLDKMLNTTCRKSGHSSALLNVNLTFQFLECTHNRFIGISKQFWTILRV